MMRKSVSSSCNAYFRFVTKLLFIIVNTLRSSNTLSNALFTFTNFLLMHYNKEQTTQTNKAQRMDQHRMGGNTDIEVANKRTPLSEQTASRTSDERANSIAHV